MTSCLLVHQGKLWRLGRSPAGIAGALREGMQRGAFSQCNDPSKVTERQWHHLTSSCGQSFK